MQIAVRVNSLKSRGASEFRCPLVGRLETSSYQFNNNSQQGILDNRNAQDIFLLFAAALVTGTALQYKELIAYIDEDPKAERDVELDGKRFRV